MQHEPTSAPKMLHALGLCARARKLIVGTPMICEAMRRGKEKILLVICASDNSENTRKRLSDRCAYYGVRLVYAEVGGEALSQAIGKSGRVAAVAVTDANLCRLVEGTLKNATYM